MNITRPGSLVIYIIDGRYTQFRVYLGQNYKYTNRWHVLVSYSDESRYVGSISDYLFGIDVVDLASKHVKSIVL